MWKVPSSCPFVTPDRKQRQADFATVTGLQLRPRPLPVLFISARRRQGVHVLELLRSNGTPATVNSPGIGRSWPSRRQHIITAPDDVAPGRSALIRSVNTSTKSARFSSKRPDSHAQPSLIGKGWWLYCGEVPRYYHHAHTQPPQCRHRLTNIRHHRSTMSPPCSSSLTPCRHRLSTLFPPLPVAS